MGYDRCGKYKNMDIRSNRHLSLLKELNQRDLNIYDISKDQYKVFRDAAKNGDLYLSRHFDFSLQSLNEPAQQDSVIQNLALEIQRSFDYFESQMGQVPPRTISLIGPDSNVPLAKMLSGSIAADVAWLDLVCCYGNEQTTERNEINSFAAMAGAIREVFA